MRWFRAETHFNLTPAEYEAKRAGHLERRRLDVVRDALTRRVALGQVKTVVELGSGTGKLLADLASGFPQLSFVGVDVAQEMVSYAGMKHQAPNLAYQRSDVAQDQLHLGCEFAYSVDLIHHVHDQPGCFQAVRQLLPTGGTWLVMEPNILHPYVYLSQERLRRAGFDEDHFRPWSAEPLFRSAGFAIRSRRFRFLFPGWVRRVPRILGPVERLCERVPVLGGSIVYLLQAGSAAPGSLDGVGSPSGTPAPRDGARE